MRLGDLDKLYEAIKHDDPKHWGDPTDRDVAAILVQYAPTIELSDEEKARLFFCPNCGEFVEE